MGLQQTIPRSRSAAGEAGPLLKWAGGKRQLLPYIRALYPRAFNRYIEPFLGSGAVFFDLQASGRLRGREAVLVDSNADLIGCYAAVRDGCDAVIRALEPLADGHRSGGRTHYYAVRDTAFNPLRDQGRQPDGRIAYTPELAAMFIYLNRTGFNGLFRLNARGGFNVPAGRYERPTIVDREKLRRVAEALARPGVRLIWGSFDSARDIAERGDFVYCDPPYAPVSRTANFTAYTAGGFSAVDQSNVQAFVIELAARGCWVVLSNSAAPTIERLYAGDARARSAGLRVQRVPARRSINSDAGGRGAVSELLVSNVARQRVRGHAAPAGKEPGAPGRRL